MIALALVCGAAGQTGDRSASLIKRKFGSGIMTASSWNAAV